MEPLNHTAARNLRNDFGINAENISSPILLAQISIIEGYQITIILADEQIRTLQLSAEQEYLLDMAWPGVNIHLIDWCDNGSTLSAARIILDPDYLIDTSRIAACFKDYGPHALHYIFDLISPHEASAYNLLGNTVNQFFDDLIMPGPTYKESLIDAFHADAINFLCVDDIRGVYFDQICNHYNNIKHTIKHDFTTVYPPIKPNNGMLEPSFVCPELGIQGRMDFLETSLAEDGKRPYASLIELKSGKMDEFNKCHKLSHFIQVQLYAEILHYNQKLPYDSIYSYLFYSRYPHLDRESTLTTYVDKAIDLRNQIIGYLHKMEGPEIEEVFNVMQLDEMCTKPNKLWLQYDRPPLEQICQSIDNATPMMRQWFFEQLQFVIREHHLSKTGLPSTQSDYYGTASLWATPIDQKLFDGEAIAHLKVIHHESTQRGIMEVTFAINNSNKTIENHTEGTSEFTNPNFRQGDDVLFYRNDYAESNSANSIIVRGNIKTISDCEISIVLRQPLRESEFNHHANAQYTCEHDSVNSSISAQCRSIYAMLHASKRWQQLLIENAIPAQPTIKKMPLTTDHSSADFTMDSQQAQKTPVSQQTQQSYVNGIVERMLTTQDYFLLVGPPGTGKTSVVLHRLIEHLYNDTEENILLLSFTHRAVDEICQSISSIDGLDYMRMGHSVHASADTHPHLLRWRADKCKNRIELQDVINQCRVFVSTTASMNSQRSLFKLKKFDTIIVDEASQLMEFQVVELLTHARRFILIGDHKQLPAVSLQSESRSLFERLYHNALKTAPEVIGTLIHQGRMHPEIAKFANEMFYSNKLQIIPLPHQQETELYAEHLSCDTTFDQLINNRYLFINVPLPATIGQKYNPGEAQQVAALVKKIQQLYETLQKDWADNTLGIIAPYRSQIAAIRHAMADANVRDWDYINVDTVERYQGSQRDIIIYSTTVSTNAQLNQLSVCCNVDDVIVDRKLNVAITRARKQLIVVGNASLLATNEIYRQLIDMMKK